MMIEPSTRQTTRHEVPGPPLELPPAHRGYETGSMELTLGASDRSSRLAASAFRFAGQPLGASPDSSGVMPDPGVLLSSLSFGSRVASREDEPFGSAS